MRVVGVILAGGQGKRLFPISRPGLAKQFVPLLPNGRTMFEEALARFQLPGYQLVERVIVVTDLFGLAHVEHQVRQWQMQHHGNYLPTTILVESHSGGTCMAYAEVLQYLHEDELMVVLPSDHYFTNPDALATSLTRAIDTQVATPSPVTVMAYPYPTLDRYMGWVEVEGYVTNPGQTKSLRCFHQYPSEQETRRWQDEHDWPMRFFANLGITVGTRKAWEKLFMSRLGEDTHGVTSDDYMEAAEQICKPIPVEREKEAVTIRYIYADLPTTRLLVSTIDEMVLVPAAAERRISMYLVSRAAGWTELGVYPRLLKWAIENDYFESRGTFGGSRLWTIDAHSFVRWDEDTDNFVVVTSDGAYGRNGIACGPLLEEGSAIYTTRQFNAMQAIYTRGLTIHSWGISKQDEHTVDMVFEIMPMCRMQLSRSSDYDTIIVVNRGVVQLYLDEVSPGEFVTLVPGQCVRIAKKRWYSLENNSQENAAGVMAIRVDEMVTIPSDPEA